MRYRYYRQTFPPHNRCRTYFPCRWQRYRHRKESMSIVPLGCCTCLLGSQRRRRFRYREQRFRHRTANTKSVRSGRHNCLRDNRYILPDLLDRYRFPLNNHCRKSILCSKRTSPPGIRCRRSDLLDRHSFPPHIRRTKPGPFDYYTFPPHNRCRRCSPCRWQRYPHHRPRRPPKWFDRLDRCRFPQDRPYKSHHRHRTQPHKRR